VIKTLCGIFGATLFLVFVFLSPSQASPPLGKQAPQFIGIDSNGHRLKLSDYKGKIVVLEWTNHGCPYVARHYETGNMQQQQKKATADGIVWLSIISSAPGTQGHVDGKAANELTKSRNAAPTRVILDPSGEIGKAYGARTTPHMYIISAEGTLVYKGGIDDNPTSYGDIEKNTKHYVLDALGELKAGKKITKSSSQPYGCSVKYGS